MSPTSIFVMILILAIIWGGFFLTVAVALKKEREKQHLKSAENRQAESGRH